MSKSRMNLEQARTMNEVNRVFARVKTISAEIKRSPSDGSGVFTALVSTFDREPDAMGDVVGRHAFDRTVNEARANHPGALWPVWWQHGYTDPGNAIGIITAALVTDAGLVVEGRLSIDSNEKALATYEGLLEGSLREWSIAYGVIAEHRETFPDGKSVNVLDELELLEISAVMSGANRHTRTLQVKSDTAAAQALREFLKSYARVGGATDPESIETASAVFTALWTPTTEPGIDPEVERFSKMLDALEGKTAPVSRGAPDFVDEWLAADRAARFAAAAEAEAEAERVRAWNEQMLLMPTPMAEPDIDARDADQRERDIERINQRARERKFELERDLAEQAALREGGFGDTYYGPGV